MSGCRQITAAEELVELLSLTDVRLYELTASRWEGFERPDEGPPDRPKSETQMLVRRSDTALEVRLRYQVVSPDALYAVDLGATYSSSEPVEYEDSVLTEFIQRAAFMTIHPYARTYIQTLGSMLGVGRVLLSLRRPKDMVVVAESSGEFAAASTNRPLLVGELTSTTKTPPRKRPKKAGTPAGR